MMTIQVDPSYPHHSLEDCAAQLAVIYDLMSCAGSAGIDLSEVGAAGLCNTLRAVTSTLRVVQDQVNHWLSRSQHNVAAPAAIPTELPNGSLIHAQAAAVAEACGFSQEYAEQLIRIGLAAVQAPAGATPATPVPEAAVQLLGGMVEVARQPVTPRLTEPSPGRVTAAKRRRAA